jgi:hypothetical protein
MKWIVTVIAAMLVSSAAQAAELPACNAPNVQRTFTQVARVHTMYGLRDWRESTDGKRWCYASYFADIGTFGQWRHSVFTLEWVNETEGRWWLETKTTEKCHPPSSDIPSPWQLCEK